MFKFNYYDLVLLNFSFDLLLVDVLIEFELLRYLCFEIVVYFLLFVQLKSIFYMLESLGLVRIEGNYIMLVDYVESKVEGVEDFMD